MKQQGDDVPGLLGETRFERQLERWVARATTPRGAAIVIASASIAVTLGAGLLMTVADHERYPTFGAGLWWAVQTTTTVGYGDNVPENAVGRFVAAVVMMFGIGFLTVITAAITSTFIARSRLEQAADAGPPAAEQFREVHARLQRMEAALTASSTQRSASDRDAATAEQLRELDRRLARIEAALTRSS